MAKTLSVSEKVSSDLGLSVIFPRYSCFLHHLELACHHRKAIMMEEMTINIILKLDPESRSSMRTMYIKQILHALKHNHDLVKRVDDHRNVCKACHLSRQIMLHV